MKRYIPTELRETPETPRPVTYGIGNDDGTGGFAMWYGPYPEELSCLEVVPPDDTAKIIRFNTDGSDTVVWEWKNEGWEAQDDA